MEQVLIPNNYLSDRVFRQYDNVPLAIIRELLQNSSDAGASRLDLKLEGNSFLASDNGVGMNKEQVLAYFLQVNGTSKKGGQSTTGAFGAAKELLAYAWSSWSIIGQGFQAYGDGLSYNWVPLAPGVKKGFTIGASDDKIDSYRITQETNRVVGRSYLPNISVYMNGEKIKMGRKLTDEMLVKRLKWGRLYVHKGTRNSVESSGYVYVRTRGLYTCSFSVDLPHTFYLELDCPSPEALTENRDSVKYEKRQVVDQVLHALVKDPRAITDKVKPKIKIFNLLFGRKAGEVNGEILEGGDGDASEGNGVCIPGFVKIVATGGQEKNVDPDLGDLPIEKKTVRGSSGRETEVDFEEMFLSDFAGPFAILTDGREEKEVYGKDKKLKKEVVRALSVLHYLMGDIAYQTKCLWEGLVIIPALLLVDENATYDGTHCKVEDNVHVIGIKYEDLLTGSLFDLVNVIVHELAHLDHDHHGDSFAREQARVQKMYGDRFFTIIETAKLMRSL